MLRKLVEATGHDLRVELVSPARLPDTPMGRRIGRCRRQIVDAAERHGARNVRLFGSTARGSDTSASDVDVLVDLDDDVGIVGLAALEQELAAILGRRVDVVPARSLKSEVAGTALSEAIAL